MSTPIERLETLAAQPKGQGKGHIERVHRADEAWVCDVCGFMFWAGHTDDGTDGYSCPACFEAAVEPLLPDLLAAIKAAKTLHEAERAYHTTLTDSAARAWGRAMLDFEAALDKPYRPAGGEEADYFMGAAGGPNLPKASEPGGGEEAGNG